MEQEKNTNEVEFAVVNDIPGVSKWYCLCKNFKFNFNYKFILSQKSCIKIVQLSTLDNYLILTNNFNI